MSKRTNARTGGKRARRPCSSAAGGRKPAPGFLARWRDRRAALPDEAATDAYVEIICEVIAEYGLDHPAVRSARDEAKEVRAADSQLVQATMSAGEDSVPSMASKSAPGFLARWIEVRTAHHDEPFDSAFVNAFTGYTCKLIIELGPSHPSVTSAFEEARQYLAIHRKILDAAMSGAAKTAKASLATARRVGPDAAAAGRMEEEIRKFLAADPKDMARA